MHQNFGAKEAEAKQRQIRNMLGEYGALHAAATGGMTSAAAASAAHCYPPPPLPPPPHLMDHAALFGAWYGYNFYPAAVAAYPHMVNAAINAALAAVAECEQQPRCKKRKLSSGAAAAAASSSSSAGAASGASADPDSLATHVQLSTSRGVVTFRPYDDHNKPGLIQSGMIGYRNCHWAANGEETGRTTLKRKHGSYSGKEAKSSGDARRDLMGRQMIRGAAGERVEADSGRTTVNSLLPEILEMIFRHLDIKSKGRAAKVCTRWRDAAYCKSVWKGVEARLHLGRSNPHLYPSLVRRGIKKVQVLSLKRSLRELVNGIPNLESLNLSGCYNLTDSALDSAFNRDQPSLLVLNLSLCKDVSDSSLGRISTHCKNLKSLDLGGCAKVTNAGLMFVSWGLKQLEHLNLRSCRQISDHGIGQLAGIEDTKATMPTTAAPSSIRDLGLQDCQKLTDDALKFASVGMPELRRINLSFCSSVTDTGLKSLARLPKMDDLNVRSCENVSDIGIGFLSGEESPASARLRSLDASFCTNVSDAGLRHISAGLPALRSLSMTTCAVTDQGLERLAGGKAGASLEELNVGQCVTLTDAGLKAVGDKMKSLRVLDLYGCAKISEAAIGRVRTQLPRLERLKMEL